MKLVSGIVLGGLTALVCSAAVLPEPNLNTIYTYPSLSVKWNLPTQNWSSENSAVCRDILNYMDSLSRTNCQDVVISIELTDGMAHDEYRLDYKYNSYKVTASAPRGVYYAVATIRQMLLDRDIEYRAGSISDKPLWQHRYVSDTFQRANRDLFVDLAANKISGVTLRVAGFWLDPEFEKNFAEQLSAIKQIKEADVADVMVQMHLLMNSPYAPVNLSKEEEIVNLIDHCRLFAEQGVDMIMLAVDDLTPREGANYTFGTEEEKQRFRNSAGLGHGYVTKRVAEAMAKEFPDLKISMVVAPYVLDPLSVDLPEFKTYFKDWSDQAPDDVYLVWTGSGTFSPTVTQADLEQIQSLVPNHPVFMFSNSNGHAGSLALWETEYVDTLREAGDGHVVLWGTFASQLERIYYRGANAYFWQGAENFDALKAYHDSAVIEFGEEAAEALLPLQRAYQNYLAIKSRGNRDASKPAFDAFKAAYAVAAKVKDRNGNLLPLYNVKGELDLAEELMNMELKSVTISQEPVTIKLTERIEGKGEDMPTTMTMAYDGTNILLTFDVVNPAEINQKQLPHDSQIFLNDDVIEIFLQPAPIANEWIYAEIQGNAAVHFCLDSAGNMFEENGTSGGFSYDADWDVKIEDTPTGWKAYVTIPVASCDSPGVIYQKPTDGMIWKGNFHRVNNKSGFVQSWGTAGTSFHGPEYLGVINFKE